MSRHDRFVFALEAFVTAAAGVLALGLAQLCSAAPVVLDDFEVDEGHFSFSPTFSGSTRNIASATADRTTTFAQAGIGAELITFSSNNATTDFPTSRIRFLSGNPGATANGGNPAQNVDIVSDDDPSGFVGYFARTTTPGLQASIILDDGATHEQAPGQAIIADGLFHLYQFSLDATDYIRFAGTGGTSGIDNPTVTIDSIAILGPKDTPDMSLIIDTVAYNEDGDLTPLVPEPAALAVVSLGAVGLVIRRPRTK